MATTSIAGTKEGLPAIWEYSGGYKLFICKRDFHVCKQHIVFAISNGNTTVKSSRRRGDFAHKVCQIGHQAGLEVPAKFSAGRRSNGAVGRRRSALCA